MTPTLEKTKAEIRRETRVMKVCACALVVWLVVIVVCSLFSACSSPPPDEQPMQFAP